MALTVEQQAEVEKQAAISAAQVNANAGEANKQRKTQYLNIAYATLLENKRSLPVEQRQITPAEITAFADSLNAYVNS
jgi:hypothetical protein